MKSSVLALTVLLCLTSFGFGQKLVSGKDQYGEEIAERDNFSNTTAADGGADTEYQTTPAPAVYTTAMKYGYATASVTIISALAFVGILAIPALGSRFYTVLMQCFIALGIGTLTADALFHLIPYAIGVGDGASTNEDENDYLWKLCACLGGIWLMFLFEKCMKLFGAAHSHDHHHHNHDDLQQKTGVSEATVTVTVTSFSGEEKNASAHGNEVAIQNSHAHSETEEESDNKSIDLEQSKTKENPTLLGIPIIAVMILIGDALHNFGDGLALGVAFSESWVTGVGTSLAIFCHELPHEFSDFALYLNSGVSKTKALLLNFAAACCCYIGLYIGLGISNDEEIRRWLLAIIAGIFLYVAFVDVFPELWHEDKKRPWTTFILQNFGLLLGWALLLLIALYEDDLENSIG